MRLALLVGCLVWPLLLAWIDPWSPSLLQAFLPVLSWVVPGGVAATLIPRAWPQRRVGVWLWAAAAWCLPMVVCAAGVAVAFGVGGFVLDVGGEGLVAQWGTTDAGRTAMRVATPEGVAQLEAALMLTAPIYDLPRSLSVVWIAWAVARDRAWRAAWVAALFLSAQAVAGYGAEGHAVQIVAASVAWSTLGVGVAVRARAIWPAVLFAGAVTGCVRLVPLCGVPAWPDSVGWSGLLGIGMALGLGLLLIAPWRSRT